MSYNTKYQIDFKSKRGITGRVDIQKQDYSGAITKLALLPDGLSIDYKFSDWFNPIIGQSCELNILNNNTDWYELEDLMTLDEREFRIVINASDNLGNEVELFDGFINSDTVSQNYLSNSNFRLIGSNYVSKIANLSPEFIEIEGKTPPINIINSAFNLTGKDSSVYVRCKLKPYNAVVAENKTALNICAVETQNLWKNNVEREDGLKCLDKLLKPFDFYTYYWNKNWYLERYSELKNDKGREASWEDSDDKTYMVYNSSTNHTWYSTTSNVNTLEPVRNIFDYDHTGSQTISMIPGLKRLDVKFNQSTYYNLTAIDFRGWKPYAWMENPVIEKSNWIYPTSEPDDPLIGSIIIDTSLYTTNIGDISYPSKLDASTSNVLHYLSYQAFKIIGPKTKVTTTVTTPEEGNIVLNIKWKWFEPTEARNPLTKNVLFHYTVMDYADNKYITYDNATSKWYKDYNGSVADAAQVISVPYEDIVKNNYSYELNGSIPLTDVSGGTTGNVDYVCRIGFAALELEDSSIWQKKNIIGDVVITTSTPKQDNLIRGLLETNTLNTKSTELDYFDIDSLNFKNGIYYSGADFNERTSLWEETDSSLNVYSIAEWLIGTKLNLYSKSRRVISSEMIYPSFIKPMSVWKDNLDPSERYYIATSYRYNPLKDTYNIDWWEYDVTTEFNFN